MSVQKVLRPMAVYELMEHWARILAVVFAILAAFAGYWAYKLGRLKSEAARLETKWSDTKKNVAAVRYSFSSDGRDLDFLYALIQIKVVKGSAELENSQLAILGKESEIYLPPGTYEVEFTTRQYEKTSQQIDVRKDMVGQRIWQDVKLHLPNP